MGEFLARLDEIGELNADRQAGSGDALDGHLRIVEKQMRQWARQGKKSR